MRHTAKLTVTRAFVFSLAVFAFLSQPIAVASEQDLVRGGNLPPHTVFYSKSHGSIIFATGNYFASNSSEPNFIYIQNGAKHSLHSVSAFPPEGIKFSRDGTRLIVVNSDFTSDVRRASDLHLLIQFPHSYYAWWEGNKIGYLNGRDGCLFSQGHRYHNQAGRSDLVAAFGDGRYLLSVRQLKPGTDANGDTPTQRVGLWQRSAKGRLRFMHTLAITDFDRFEGDPCHLAVLSSNTVVFGLPLGGALWYDYLCLFRSGQAMRYIKDSHGNLLRFGPQEPIVTKNAIIGLAGSAESPIRYLYCVTGAGVTLHPVATDVMFVVYDPVRGIGLGVSSKSETSIKYSK